LLAFLLLKLITANGTFVILFSCMDPKDILAQLGFSEKEVRVYLAALQLGMCPVSSIARRAKLNRSTTFVILKVLADRGIAQYSLKGRARYYTVLPPRDLHDYFTGRLSMFYESIPIIPVLTHSAVTPQVTLYEGMDDVRRVYEEYVTAKSSIWNYFHPEETYECLGYDYVQSFVQKRIARNIPIRCIVQDTPQGRRVEGVAKKELREVRVVSSKSLTIKAEILLYDNVITIFMWEHLLALKIENEAIVDTQKGIFDLVWKSLKP
jgi:HTH-type transcriptional regulator, sugar sensing transcriptional regulator